MPNLYQNNCKYTPLVAANGTNTVNPGQAGEAAAGTVGVSGNLPTTFSVFYGVSVLGLGTNTTTGTGTGGVAEVVNVYDVIPPSGLGTNTATVTNQIANGTASSVGQMVTSAGVSAGMPALGVRYYGELVVVISGATTLGTANCLWD